jgi:hypothetical protein
MAHATNNIPSSDKPHNPMVNSGAIVVSSLIKKDWNMADRFDYVSVLHLTALYSPFDAWPALIAMRGNRITFV